MSDNQVSVLIASIALAGSIGAAALTVFGAPVFQERRSAKKRLDEHREPLLRAAYELQARLYNILQLQFIEKYILDEHAVKRDAAVNTTLYVFAQFFAWRELIRREVAYLRFPQDRRTRNVDRLLRDIEEVVLSEGYGGQFMVWRVEQRGLGEQMLKSVDGRTGCRGYADFLQNRSSMEEWLGPMKRDLRGVGDVGRARLAKLQHLLLDLMAELDYKEKRYPSRLEHAQIDDRVFGQV